VALDEGNLLPVPGGVLIRPPACWSAP
jgi:hypothetical protein